MTARVNSSPSEVYHLRDCFRVHTSRSSNSITTDSERPEAGGGQSNPQTFPTCIAWDLAAELNVLLAEHTTQMLLFHKNEQMQVDRSNHQRRQTLQRPVSKRKA